MTADAAFALMSTRGVRNLAVVESGHCVGLLTFDAIVTARPSEVPTVPLLVGELCRRPPPTVQSRCGPAGAVKVMADVGSDAVVVLNGVHVLGVLEGHQAESGRTSSDPVTDGPSARPASGPSLEGNLTREAQCERVT
jgi:CBS domain-containing protein